MVVSGWLYLVSINDANIEYRIINYLRVLLCFVCIPPASSYYKGEMEGEWYTYSITQYV